MKSIIIISLILVGGVIIFAQASAKSEVGNDSSGILTEKKTAEAYPNVEPFMKFWSKLRALVSQKRIDLNKDYRLHLKADFPKGKISEGDISFDLTNAQPELLELLKDFLVTVDESNLLKVIALEMYQEAIAGADLQIDFAEKEVNFNLELKTDSENTAERVTTRFKMLFAATSYILKNNPEGEFYKNAVISSAKERIFVRGNISRANLEKFLSYSQ